MLFWVRLGKCLKKNHFERQIFKTLYFFWKPLCLTCLQRWYDMPYHKLWLWIYCFSRHVFKCRCCLAVFNYCQWKVYPDTCLDFLGYEKGGAPTSAWKLFICIARAGSGSFSLISYTSAWKLAEKGICHVCSFERRFKLTNSVSGLRCADYCMI